MGGRSLAPCTEPPPCKQPLMLSSSSRSTLFFFMLLVLYGCPSQAEHSLTCVSPVCVSPATPRMTLRHGDCEGRVAPPELALVLAASEAANGIAWEIALAELADAGAPEIRVQASLHYAE